MSVIIISRGAHHKGEEVAEITAQKLGFPCISRDIFIEASKKYNIPEIKLKKSMERAPGFLNRLGFEKKKYLSYIQSSLMKRLREDNIVYHGLGTHFFVKDIDHAILIRIIVDIKDRVKYCMQSERVSEIKAYEMLKKLDGERKKWGQYLYGIDISDPSLYDMVININRLSVDDAAQIICNSVAIEKYKTTPESQQAMEDLALAAEVKAVLVSKKPVEDIFAQNGIVSVRVQASLFEETQLAEEIEELGKTIEGVKDIKIEILPYIQPIETF